MKPLGARRYSDAMNVTGRNYADRNNWHCFECERTVNQLTTARVSPAYLKICGCNACRVLLCWSCRVAHETMHELAGDKVGDPWTKEKRNVFSSF